IQKFWDLLWVIFGPLVKPATANRDAAGNFRRYTPVENTPLRSRDEDTPERVDASSTGIYIPRSLSFARDHSSSSSSGGSSSSGRGDCFSISPNRARNRALVSRRASSGSIFKCLA